MANITEVSTNIDTNTSNKLPAAKTTTPVAEVFNTPELLEGILCQLPVLDLVIATGFNKTFRNAFKASPRLQRQLFMLPTNDKPKYWKLVRRDTKGAFSPVDDYESDSNGFDATIVHMSLFGPEDSLGFHLVPIPSDTDDSVPCRRSLQVVSLCPLLSRPLRCYYDLTTSVKSVSFGVKPNAKAVTIGHPWSHMFLSNPPCKTVRYDLTWDGLVDGTWKTAFAVRGQFHCEEGITMASLINDALNRRDTVTVFTSSGGLQGLDSSTARGSVAEHTNTRAMIARFTALKKSSATGESPVKHISNTTVQEQITAFQNQHSGCVVQLKAFESNIHLVSSYAPTEKEYKQMSTMGLAKTSVL
jgi:hypothetical protein